MTKRLINVLNSCTIAFQRGLFWDNLFIHEYMVVVVDFDDVALTTLLYTFVLLLS